jgi:hypothetical protein
MSVQKTSAQAVLFLISFVVTGGAVRAVEQENERVLSVIRAVADAWKDGQPAATYFESSATAVDDIPPFFFKAPGAMKKVRKAMRDEQLKGGEGGKAWLTVLPPKTIDIKGAHAYVAGPWTGQPSRADRLTFCTACLP